MARLEVLTVPHPMLREKAKPIEKIDTRIGKLMDDMLQTMYEDDGIGLAANQVGVLDRVIVVDVSDTRDGSEALIMANPEIIWESEEEFTYREGCLSVRPDATKTTADLYANVTRPEAIRVKFMDRNGDEQEIEASELFSQCIQHEMDHLDGILFIDHISTLKRSMILKKIEKLKKIIEG